MRTGGLTDREETFQIGTPPRVDRESAVVVLGADVHLQQLGGQIDPGALLQVEVIGRPVHVDQPLDRAVLQGAGALQVGACFRLQLIGVEGLVRNVVHEVQIDPATTQLSLAVDQQIDDR